MDEIINKFWKRWEESKELDRPKILKELIFQGYLKEDEVLEIGFYGLLNSYLEDLKEYIEYEVESK